MKLKTEKSLLLYLKEIRKYPLLTFPEEKELLRRAKGDDGAAREKLILSYQRLILAICKRYIKSGIPLADLINEANIALMEAIRDFNPRKRMNFSLFARFRINYHLLNILENKGIIRIPPVKKILLKKLFDQLPKLTASLDRSPTSEELARALAITPTQLEEILLLADGLTISLDQEPEDAPPLTEVLALPSFPSPEEIFKKKEIREEIQSALNTLSPREREVVEKHFGLLDANAKSLQKIGEELGVSREFVRQIKKRALKKLRSKIKSQSGRLIFGFE